MAEVRGVVCALVLLALLWSAYMAGFSSALRECNNNGFAMLNGKPVSCQLKE